MRNPLPFSTKKNKKFFFRMKQIIHSINPLRIFIHMFRQRKFTYCSFQFRLVGYSDMKYTIIFQFTYALFQYNLNLAPLPFICIRYASFKWGVTSERSVADDFEMPSGQLSLDAPVIFHLYVCCIFCLILSFGFFPVIWDHVTQGGH